jgi:hypothetical protein
MALYVSYGQEADACWVSERAERLVLTEGMGP